MPHKPSRETEPDRPEPVLPNTFVERLTPAQMHHHDCLILGKIEDITQPTVMLFQPERGVFELKTLRHRKSLLDIADVFVETPELIVCLIKQDTSWMSVGWEMSKYRLQLDDAFQYSAIQDDKRSLLALQPLKQSHAPPGRPRKSSADHKHYDNRYNKNAGRKLP